VKPVPTEFVLDLCVSVRATSYNDARERADIITRAIKDVENTLPGVVAGVHLCHIEEVEKDAS
jgi:hypothetical protein